MTSAGAPTPPTDPTDPTDATDRADARSSIAGYAAFLPPARRAVGGSLPEAETVEIGGHALHVLRRPDPAAPARLLLVHGAGGHAGALWPIAAQLRGLDLAAVDLPLYGGTRSPDPRGVRYGDWIDLLTAFAERDRERDDRPLLLLGASIGGLLALEVAARTPAVDGVAATCLLDPGDPRALARMTRYGAAGVALRPLARLARGPLARATVPMRLVADLGRMSRDPGLSRRCAEDPLGGGAPVPLGFLASYASFAHTPPERIRTPVLVVHPARDAWTPLALTRRVAERLAGTVRIVELERCGHFPIEEPGLTTLVAAVDAFVDTVAAARTA